MNVFKDRLLYLMTQNERTNLKRGVMKDPSLEEKRKQKGLSTYDVAALCGASAQSVSNWINSKNGIVPKPATMLKLGEAFGVTTAWLTGETDAPNQEVTIEFAPFREFGFSYAAYESLKKMKECGTDMIRLMMGINCILESRHSDNQEWAKHVLDEPDGDYTEEERATAKEYLKEPGDYELPVVESLNQFFDMHSEGEYVKIPFSVMEKLYGTDSTIGFDELQRISKLSHPDEEDEAKLAVFSNELRKIKGRIIKERLAKREKANSEELYRPDVLTILNDYYNG